MKKCSSCGELKNINEFGKRKAMRDGIRSACKICENIGRRAYYIKNAERLRTTAINYNRAHKEDKALYQKNYVRSELGKELDRKKTKERKLKNPEKLKANGALRWAVKSGRTIRPSSCSSCGKTCKPDGHHWSYLPENWVDVVWLCRSCHLMEHARLNRIA